MKSDILDDVLLENDENKQENVMQMPEVADEEEEQMPAPPPAPAEPPIIMAPDAPIAPPPLAGHQVPGWRPMPHLPPLNDLRGPTLNARNIGDMFPDYVFDGGAAFIYHSDPESSLMAMFGVKCTANTDGTCPKTDCDHSLESPEAVKMELMPMPVEKLFSTYAQMMHHDRLFELFHEVYAEVFQLRGLSNAFNRRMAEWSDNGGPS